MAKMFHQAILKYYRPSQMGMISQITLSQHSPVNFVIPWDTLPHDFQQVVICIPTVDQQRLLHGHSQMQLTLKHLHREAKKQNRDHNIYYYITASSFHSTQYIADHCTMIRPI